MQKQNLKQLNKTENLIFLDYSRDAVQYVVLDSEQFELLSAFDKLNKRFVQLNRDLLLCSSIKEKEKSASNFLPRDVIEFVMKNENSSVFISKNSQKILNF